ncbi:MAG: DNA repair protein RecO, partial [Nitrospiria bacterium]
MTPEGQPSRPIYRLLLDGLTSLEKGTDPQLSVILFVIRLITYSGYQPRWDQCLKCHQSRSNAGQALYFSASSGGTICSRCAKGMDALVSISQGTLAFLNASQKMDYARSHRLKPSSLMRKEIEMLFRDHLTYITGTPFPKFVPQPTPPLSPA